MYAKIIVDIVNSNIDREFDYLIPEGINVCLGQTVKVPFAGKTAEGIVLDFSDTSSVPDSKIKCIQDVLFDLPVVTEEQITTAKIISKQYRIPLAASLRMMIPSGIRKKAKQKIIKKAFISADYNTGLRLLKTKNGQIRSQKQYDIFCDLYKNGSIVYNTDNAVQLKSLASKGIAEIKEVKENDVPFIIHPVQVDDPVLTSEQELALKKINNSSGSRFLIHGVTGSGKTELYIRLIKQTLSEGKTCILLVPEISLTPQTYRFVASRVDTQIAMFHSGLNETERFNEWKKVISGRAGLVIGARSAVFAPLDNIGLIIIDEEHDNSYKADNYPKYNASEIAAIRCGYFHARLVLGSATPSVKSYYLAENGYYELIELYSRVNNVEMPDVHIVDMKRELLKGNYSLLSSYLVSAIDRVLKNGNQVMLFLNRRGYSNYLMCHSCGHVIKCSACDVSMTYHKTSGILKCHYCGRTAEVPEVCPKCGKPYIKYVGSGTQKLEDILHVKFPHARIIRMDLDTTHLKDAHQKIYSKFINREADILLGTQMITKGFDFPGVMLAGIINADNMLNYPDYRSNEETFMSITQIAGRSGRKIKGDVVLQTYNPDHFVVQAAAKHDYREFYSKELFLRKITKKPPFSFLVKITFSGRKEAETISAVKDFLNKLSTQIKDKKDILSINASESDIKRINNYIYYEINITLKKDCNHDTINTVKHIFEGTTYKNVLIGLDLE